MALGPLNGGIRRMQYSAWSGGSSLLSSSARMYGCEGKRFVLEKKVFNCIVFYYKSKKYFSNS